jgi:hypothetical protein
MLGRHGFVRRPQARLNGRAQVHGTHIGRIVVARHVLDVDDAQPGELERQLILAVCQFGG